MKVNIMNAEELLKERRSVREYKDQIVDRNIMKEIVSISSFAPSWANFQIARYTLVDDVDTIKKLSHDGVNGFVYNTNTLKNAKGVAVLSYVKGKSGKMEQDADDFATSKANVWEIFDAGLACQQFCLAAHSKGVGTVIMGIIDDDKISQIVNLPKEETVAALIVYGYEEGEHPTAPVRKSAEEIMRFI